MCQHCYPGLTWEQQQQKFAEGLTAGSSMVKLTMTVEMLVEIDPANHPGESDWGDARDYCIPAQNAMLDQLRGSPNHFWVESNGGNIDVIDLTQYT